MKNYSRRSRLTAVLFSVVVLLVSVTAVSALTYQVIAGDTLTAIAYRFGTTVNAIVQANSIVNPNLIYVGQLLEIPDGQTTPTPPPTGTPPSPTPSPTSQPPTATPPPVGTIYIVQAGDTLSSIARRFGVTVNAIAQANGITNPNLIYVGQRLVIPDGSTPSPTPIPPTPPAVELPLGGQTLNLANQAQMEYAGMEWIKVQHKCTAGDDANVLAGIINDAHANGFSILISITGKDAYPAPGSIDFNAFAQFAGGVAALAPDAIEVWNEMNIDFEWPAGEINPTAYVNNMLAPSYHAIKAANPNVMVISGALAPTGFDNTQNAWADNRYVYGMAAAGAAAYADCIGVHHNAGATSPYVSYGHPADDGSHHYSWYFQPTMNLYYGAFSGTRQLCFTELGYLSGEGFPALPPNFWWAGNTTVANQATWLAEAKAISASSGKVRMMVIYNVDFIRYDPDSDPQAGYAIIRPDGTCPACEVLHGD